jgi:ATP-dependent Clp protease ATP-binding subunit ClpA
MLAHASPRMLFIDEIHNLLSCSARDQRAALNAIKYLANKLRVSIVAAGTYEALHVMRSDSQIAFSEPPHAAWKRCRSADPRRTCCF